MALKSPLAAYAEWNELPDKTDPVALHNMFARYIAHDVVLNGVPGGPVKGLDDAIAFQLQFGVAFPDLTFKVLSAGYADGNPLSTFILYEAVASMVSCMCACIGALLQHRQSQTTRARIGGAAG